MTSVFTVSPGRLATPTPTSSAAIRGRAALLVAEAQGADRRGRREEARRLYERALRALEPADEPALVSDILRRIGSIHQQEGDGEAALDCFGVALAASEASGDEGGAGLALNAIATVHLHQGRFAEAQTLLLEARTLARRSGATRLAAMTSQNLGVVANLRGQHDEALAHFEASLAEYRALALPRHACMTLNNLGLLYVRLERWLSAERAFDEAVALSQACGDLGMRIQLEVNRAALWSTRRDHARARAACELALELSRQTRDPRLLGAAYRQHGVVEREAGELERAETSLQMAMRLADERRHPRLAGETSHEMALVYRAQGRTVEAMQSFNRAHRLYAQRGTDEELSDAGGAVARLERDLEQAALVWSSSVEERDRHAAGHGVRVADVAGALYEEARLPADRAFWFRLAALLRNVGQISIPVPVLNKPGRLTTDEWAAMREHPERGARLLTEARFPADVVEVVLTHHERWDGAGYPRGLAGDAIPIEARVLCIADAYDALTAERSYKKAVPHAQAMELLRAEAGGQFDPVLFERFEELMRGNPALWSGATPGDDPGRDASPASRTDGDAEAVDHLTGALLRRSFTTAAEDILRRLRPAELPPSLLVIDIDHFKLVNDSYGHLAGDDVLRMVLGVLRRTLRTADVIGRYGGDELVVLLPRTPLEHAREVADRIRARVEEERCVVRGRPDATIAVTLSIGVAVAESGEHPEALFAAADRALYEAKRAGRNRVALASRTETQSPPSLLLTRFVGRERELRRLVTMLEEARSGRPRIVAIAGEAGVGKSTIVRQLMPEVRLRGGAVLVGRCAEADIKAPYAPWAEIIAALASQPGAPVGGSWNELPRLVPALAPTGAPAAAHVAGSKYALFDEITGYLRHAAASRPLVLVLDDMQWADAASWDTLEHLMAALRTEPILVALTIRSEEAGAEATSRRRRLSRDERFAELAVPRLTIVEVARWLASVSGGDDLGDGLLATLYRHSEGNPFLVVQVMRSLLEEGGLRFEDGAWRWRETTALRLPVAVSDLMSRRLDRLSIATRGILTTAAVVGRSFDIDLVIAAGAGTESQVLDALDEAVAAAVLERSRQHADVYSFTHSLLLDAILDTASARRLARIHEAVARALESRTPTAAGEIARHFDAAGRAAEAYTYAMAAARAAAMLYAHDDAAALYDLARRRAVGPRERLEAALGLITVLDAAARYDEAENLCEVTLGYVDQLDAGDPQEVVSLHVRCLRERFRMLQGAPVHATLSECARLEREVEAAGAERERVALLTVMSQAHVRAGELPEAEALARSCVETARGLGDERLLADALTRLGATLTNQRKSEAIALYHRAEAIFRRLGDRHGLARCRINVGVTHLLDGEGPEAERAYLDAVALAGEAHAPDLSALASLKLGALYMRAGRFHDAGLRFDEALRLFTTIRDASHQLETLLSLGHLMRESGDPARALQRYESAIVLARRIGQPDAEIVALAASGLAAASLARADDTDRAAERVASLLEARPDWWFEGRELAEALCISSLLSAGDQGGAGRRFDAAMALLRHATDRAGAAWLVAELARALAAIGRRDIPVLVASHANDARLLGIATLDARYRALLERPEAITPAVEAPDVPSATIA